MFLRDHEEHQISRSQFRNLTAENAAEQLKNTLKGIVEEIQKPPDVDWPSKSTLRRNPEAPDVGWSSKSTLRRNPEAPDVGWPKANLPLEEIQKPPTSIGRQTYP